MDDTINSNNNETTKVKNVVNIFTQKALQEEEEGLEESTEASCLEFDNDLAKLIHNYQGRVTLGYIIGSLNVACFELMQSNMTIEYEGQ